MLRILRVDILLMTRRNVEGNLMIFETFHRCQWQNGPRPPGLKEYTRLKSKMLKKHNVSSCAYSPSFECFLSNRIA